MYAVVADPYCYPGTKVLKNKVGLRSQKELSAFEAEITDQRAQESLPKGHLSYRHYRALHHHLFQDVYAWAGRVRTVRISKQGSMFCYPENINGQMKNLFGGLRRAQFFTGLSAKKFAAKAAHFLAELNAIHPFREGNGRTQLSFLVLLAERAGHPLDAKRIKPRVLLKATVESFHASESPLANIIEGLILS